MELRDLVPGVIGSFVGVVGWLLVGIYIQRRQFVRQARNAAKAAFFELDVNRVAVTVARDTGSFAKLDRSAYERLLPELATILPAGELKIVVAAYMTHAGYEQLANAQLPGDVRHRALEAILAAHDHALDTLRLQAFNAAERHAIQSVEGS